MAWPDVSVIVPNYNDGLRLRKSLGALLCQSYVGTVEVIVIDNGSEEKLDSLKAEFPSVIFLFEERIGSYNARNTGILHAKGQVFAFTDSDCEPNRNWLYYGVKALLKNPGTAFVGGKIESFLVNSESPNVAELYDFVVGFHQGLSVKWRGYSATANLFTRRDVMTTWGHLKDGFAPAAM